MKLTKQAKLEQQTYNLLENETYLERLIDYENGYLAKMVKFKQSKLVLGVPEKSMLKALRMCPWQNTADDWARLHATESMSKFGS